ncbi:cupin domain-containing protein [Cryobacterium sp. TmT3-12]|uniref:cupin domain-containing protein n=2 Tax=Cryobacterium TaxID=69578 RepID=UPI0015E8BB71|nr:cupin domain-containing protein [Cryobacterium sp. TmT3-12]
MKGFVDDIEDAAIRNSNFREVLYTSNGLQLVVMALEPGEDIGEEVHRNRDQFFRVEKGKGEIWIDGSRTKIRRNSAMIVPAGARHNVVNSGGKVLRLATVYAPPEHRDAIVHLTKADSQASNEHFDGTVTERSVKKQPTKAATRHATRQAQAKPATKATPPTKSAKATKATKPAAKPAKATNATKTTKTTKTAKAAKTAAKPAAKRPSTRARSANTD